MKTTRLKVRQNPGNIFGIKYLDHVRILIFKKLPRQFFIDSTLQILKLNSIYIIPAGHIHFISPNDECDFLCIDIDDSLLTHFDRELIRTTKYRKLKNIDPESTEDNDDFIRLMDTEISEEQIHNYKNKLFQIIKSRLIVQFDIRTEVIVKYGIIIDKFLDYIINSTVTLDSLRVDSTEQLFSISPQVLRRACIQSFGLTTNKVLQYHLLLCSLYRMYTLRTNLNGIAFEMGFSDTHSFRKFIKRETGFNPTQILTRWSESN